MSILIKNVDIVTSDIDNPLIKSGYIIICDNIVKSILDFKSFEEEKRKIRFSKIIDGSNMIAMAGLVNSHTHTPMTILRNFADDLSLEDWLFKHVFPAENKMIEEDIYWTSLLAMAEMIQSGTTSFADMYFFQEETANAILDSGIRSNISFSPYPFIFKNNEFTYIDNKKEFDMFFKKWNNIEDRIKVYTSVHSLYTSNEKNIKDVLAIAQKYNTGLHIHVLETKKERDGILEKYNKDEIPLLLDFGLFEVPTVMAHCVHLSENDIQILKNQKNTSIVHNPTSNLKLGSGIAPIKEILENNINVALGTDGVASNNNLNMFEEMHIASLIHKGYHMDPKIVSAEQTILMGTKNGAKAIGYENLGMIKENMIADIILLNKNGAHYTPCHNTLSSIAYSAQASDVDTVIVNGKILMENRKLKTIDIDKVKSMIAKISKRLNLS